MPNKYQNQKSLVEEGTYLQMEVIFPLRDQTRKLLMVQERLKIWKQVPRQQQQYIIRAPHGARAYP
jgi:hypothetical protein